MAAESKQELALALLYDWWDAWKEAERDPAQDVVVLAARRDEVDRLNTYCQQVLDRSPRTNALAGWHGSTRGYQHETRPSSSFQARLPSGSISV